MENESALARLRKAVIEQKTAGFPPAGEHPELRRVYDQLLAYDEGVSRATIQLIQGLSVDSSGLAAGSPLESELGRLQSIDLGDEAQLLSQYRAYKARIDRLRDLVEQALHEGETHP